MSAVYDLVLTYSATDYSYMLRQEGQTKDWLVTDSPLLPQTLITESASPSNIQPEREIQISQVDWRKGFQDFMLEDEHKYNESKNCDGRFKGEVTLAPKKLTSISYEAAPTTPTITDGGLETWQNATTPHAAWTEGAGTINRYAQNGVGTPHEGTYFGGWYDVGGGGTITQELVGSGTIANYKGMLFKVKCWIMTNDKASSTTKLKLDDGDTNTESSGAIAANNTWESVEIEHRVSYSATGLDIVITGDAGSSDYACVDDISLTLYPATSSGATIDEVQFGDTIVVAVGKNLYSTTVTASTLIATFEYVITDLCVFENYLYIAQGWSYPYWYTPDLEVYTKSTLTGGVTDNVTATTVAETAAATNINVVDSSVFSAAGVYARWGDEVIEVDAIVDATNITAIRAQLGSTAAAHATGTDIMELATVTGAKYMSNVGGGQFWISDTNSTMRDSDNPINNGTPFSSAYQVGNDDYDCTGLVDHEDIVFCRKEDDVYYLSGADVFSLLDLKSEASTTYTYGLHLWGNCLYIGSGTNSLYEYDITAGVATTISPVRYALGDANYDEEVTAICHDESYLYIALDNGSDIKILSGRWETVDGATDWYWHPLYDKTSNDITCMLISAATGAKRLYAGTDTYTDGILHFFVPVGYSAVYLETGFEAEASGEFVFPWYPSNFPTESKFWKTVDITTKCITAKTSIVPYYQIKGGSWVAMTTCTASALDGSNYPAETTDTRTIELSSERIRFKLAMAAADTDYTPILSGTGGGIAVYGVLQATKKRQIAATIQLAPQLRLRDKTRVNRVVATDLTNLRTLYKANALMTLTGPDETTYSVVFARDGYQEQLAYDKTGRKEYWWCRVLLLEV